MMNTRAADRKTDVPGGTGRSAAFTLMELLVVIVIIGILAGLLASALAKAKGKAYSVTCMGHIRQLTLASLLYAGDNDDRFPYNLGSSVTERGTAPRDDNNWVNNILNWDATNSDNTNVAFVAKGKFSHYVGRATQVYRCPADRALSDDQKQAGWTARVRSFSMNAMVGDAGENSRAGTNVFNPEYKQMKRTADVTKPTRVFVFLDEHPDSINDGYFLNRIEEWEWVDLPASYHNGAGEFGFADGHVEKHAWVHPATKPPPKPGAAGLPLTVDADKRADYQWVIYGTAIGY
jgi:prepilin-type N-terminal cleavage/methylation domain-containing protein/prepilin-type processing-associated H-X9-DG protein